MSTRAAVRAQVLVDVRIVRDALTGVGRYLARLVEEIGRLAPDDLVVRMLGRFNQEPLSPSMPMSRLHGRAGRTAPLGVLQQWLVPRALRQQPCDLYHYPNFDVPQVAGPRVVATCYDLEPLRHPELFGRKIVWFYRLFSRSLRRADRVITISESTARDVHELLGVARERITSIHLGVEEAFTPATRHERARVHARFGLPDRFVLYVGNTMPHKNLERLVDAMAIVRRAHPDVPLLLGGAPDKYRPSVERAIARHGMSDRVRFLGKVPEADLPALLSAAAVFAYPSLYEGFGLPVLEAMACGTPVVTSNRSSLPEVVGDCAITIEPLEVGAIAAAIRRVLDDASEAERLSKAGPDRARGFTWRRCAEQHLHVYREVPAR